MYVIDFETFPIDDAHRYPKPVGVSIFDTANSRAPTYYHWGHTHYLSRTPWTERLGRGSVKHVAEGVAKRALRKAWRDTRPILCHNAAYDVGIAVNRWGFPLPQWDRVHDTLWLAFLLDPNSDSLSLKDLGVQYLGREPKEQDDLHTWIQDHIISLGPRMLKHGKRPAAYIGFSPPDLAGRYSNQDTKLTWSVFKKLKGLVMGWGMWEAYERYQRSFPALRGMEERGVRVDSGLAASKSDTAQKDIDHIERYLRRQLKHDGLLSGVQLREALVKSGIMDMHRWDRWRTPKKKELQVSYEVVSRCIKPGHRGIVDGLRALSQIEFTKSSFLDKYAMSSTFKPEWIATRRHSGENRKGARTGRLSSSPNVQNMYKGKGTRVKVGSKHVTVPAVRDLVLPYERGHRICDGDVSQQELRILAFYEHGGLFNMFRDRPRTDMHDYAQAKIYEVSSQELERKYVKNTAFGILYSSGAARRAEQLGLDDLDPDVIKRMHELKKVYLEALPDVRDFIRAISRSPQHHVTHDRMMSSFVKKRRFGGKPIENDPIFTIGGRVCFVEDALVDESGEVVRSFVYKMLNTLIQGSAGDQLLEAIVLLDEQVPYSLMLTAHDQVLASVPARSANRTAKLMSHVIENEVSNNLVCPNAGYAKNVTFNVPMIADVEVKKRWQE